MRDAVRRVYSKQLRSGRPVLDVKVYSVSEFHKKKTWEDNFYLWTCAQNRQLMFGEDLLDTVCLSIERVDDLVWKDTSKFNQTLDWLERNIHYSGACCYSVEVFTTFYFIERYFFNKNLVTLGMKDEYLKKVFGNEFNRVMNIYYETLRLYPVSEVGQEISISEKRDWKFSPENYMTLFSKVQENAPLVEKIRVQVRKHVEISSIEREEAE